LGLLVPDASGVGHQSFGENWRKRPEGHFARSAAWRNFTQRGQKCQDTGASQSARSLEIIVERTKVREARQSRRRVAQAAKQSCEPMPGGHQNLVSQLRSLLRGSDQIANGSRTTIEIYNHAPHLRAAFREDRYGLVAVPAKWLLDDGCFKLLKRWIATFTAEFIYIQGRRGTNVVENQEAEEATITQRQSGLIHEAIVSGVPAAIINGRNAPAWQSTALRKLCSSALARLHYVDQCMYGAPNRGRTLLVAWNWTCSGQLRQCSANGELCDFTGKRHQRNAAFGAGCVPRLAMAIALEIQRALGRAVASNLWRNMRPVRQEPEHCLENGDVTHSQGVDDGGVAQLCAVCRLSPSAIVGYCRE